VPDCVSPGAYDPLDVVGTGIRGEIEVHIGPQSVGHGIPDDAADQIQAKASPRKPGGDIASLLHQGTQPLRNHRFEGRGDLGCTRVDLGGPAVT
jgi:hypothetical protein